MKQTLIFITIFLFIGGLLLQSASCRKGCKNPRAENYDPKAKDDDGSCIIKGCTNPRAENYDYEANLEDGSCVIKGCTDPSATNYDDAATLDDGTCIYPTGAAMFWTNNDYGVGNISVYVNNSYEGQITGYYYSLPLCFSYGCVTIERIIETYSYYAVAEDDTYWSGTISIEQGECSTMLLYISKSGEALTASDTKKSDVLEVPEEFKLKSLNK